MDSKQPDSGRDESIGDSGRRTIADLSWSRVTLAVGVVAVVGAMALHMVITASLDPKEPYGTGTVTIAGQTHDASVCESIENGIEVEYGSDGEVLHVHTMGPAEIYEGLEVQPEKVDGTFLVRRTGGVEQWSHEATVLERSTDGVTLEATFDEVGPVTMTYVTGGWCDGADPNVWWR